MRIREDLLEVIFGSISDGIAVYNSSSEVEFWNRAMEELTGITLQEALGRNCSQNLILHTSDSGESLCKTGLCPFSRASASENMITESLYIRHVSGYRIPVVNSIISIRDRYGKIEGYIEIIKNKSNDFFYQEKIHELENLALLDTLTQLPNRRYIESEISKRIKKSSRQHSSFGIIFIDLDDFKKFNDTYGHNAGDLLLKSTAKTMINAVRNYDIVGRWGGEEFIALIDEVNTAELRSIAQKIVNLISRTSISINNTLTGCTASAGAGFIKTGETIEQNIERADKLMYVSKNSGKNRVTFEA